MEAALSCSNMSSLADGLSELQANMQGLVEVFMLLQPNGTGELTNMATLNEVNDSRAVDKVCWYAYLLIFSHLMPSWPSYRAR